jgi:hypothetical protein
MTEELIHITYDFDGERLEPWQAVQRLYLAGFVDPKLLAVGYAVMMGESGRYLKAWHHNVLRNEDGTILRSADGLMEVKSTDLGFIQKNVVHNPHVVLPIEGDQSALFVEDLFAAYPKLARGDESAEIAYALYNSVSGGVKRRWTPWYAWVNGNYRKGLPSACVAVGQFLGKVLVDDPRVVVRGGA